MKLKSKVLYSAVCAMLFVMTFTTLTSVVAMGDIVNSKYLGTYYNTNNSDSFFRIRNDVPEYPIVAVTVYDGNRKIWFRGSGETVAINGFEFAADFSAPYKVNEKGEIQGNSPLKGVTIAGTVSSKTVWFKTTITVTMKPDGKEYVKT